MDDLELDQTLRDALAVMPSPSFVARVRLKITEAPPRSIFAGTLKPVSVVACALIIAAAATLSRWSGAPHKADTNVDLKAGVEADLKVGTTSPATITPSGTTNSAVVEPTFRSAETAPPAPSVVPTFRSAASDPPLPEVIIAADDIEGFRQFVTATREQRFVVTFDETPESTPWVVSDVSISPISIEPLTTAFDQQN